MATYAMEEHKRAGAEVSTGPRDADWRAVGKRAVPGVKDFAQDGLQVVVAFPKGSVARVAGSCAQTPPCSQADQPLLAGAVATPAAQASDLGGAQTRASPTAGFWGQRVAFGGGHQSLAEALGAGLRTAATPARAGGSASGHPPSPAQQRCLDGRFQGLV